MVDSLGGYTGGNYVQHLSPGEIKKMKKNMKKVPIISLKSDIYHQKEEEEAENILQKIPHAHASQETISHTITKKHGLLSKSKLLRQRFISLF